jgi:hypothetical protein
LDPGQSTPLARRILNDAPFCFHLLPLLSFQAQNPLGSRWIRLRNGSRPRLFLGNRARVAKCQAFFLYASGMGMVMGMGMGMGMGMEMGTHARVFTFSRSAQDVSLVLVITRTTEAYVISIFPSSSIYHLLIPSTFHTVNPISLRI